jgi:serine O-acetyltransferase
VTASSDEGPGASDGGAEAYPRLGAIVDALRDLRLRSHQVRYAGGRLPELPSRTATIAVVNDLAAALFPRHYGPAGLSHGALDAFVAATLPTALQALQRQVRLELELGGYGAPGDRSQYERRAHQVTGQFAEELPTIRALLETDIRAAYEGDPAATSIDEVMCCYPGVAAIVRHRLAHSLWRLGAATLARIISEVSHATTGIDIHPGARIGESFFIDHGTGVVIGETAIIGNRVRLYQGVTLGARRFKVDESGALTKNYPRHPIIEDDVVIYAGASVLGRITVGQGSSISGNVWLTHGVPPGSVVTQAKIRSGDEPDS